MFFIHIRAFMIYPYPSVVRGGMTRKAVYYLRPGTRPFTANMKNYPVSTPPKRARNEFIYFFIHHLRNLCCYYCPDHRCAPATSAGLNGLFTIRLSATPIPPISSPTAWLICRYVHHLQAILFYTPRYLWKMWEGGKIHGLIMDLDVVLCSQVEKRAKKRLLLEYLWDNLK